MLTKNLRRGDYALYVYASKFTDAWVAAVCLGGIFGVLAQPHRMKSQFGNALSRIIHVGCVKLAQAQGASAQAACGAEDTLSKIE